MAVLGNVECFVVVKKFDHVAWRRRINDRGGDELVHGFVVGRAGWVVDKTGAANVD